MTLLQSDNNKRDVTEVLGPFGYYHTIIVIIAVLRAFPTAWTLLMTPHIAPEMDHWCAPPAHLKHQFENMTKNEWRSFAIPNKTDGSGFEKCVMYDVTIDSMTSSGWIVNTNRTIECTSWYYDTSRYKKTVVNEWDLVCKKDWMRSGMQSMVMFGSLFGGLTMGAISDRFGRKRTFFSSCLFFMIVGCISSLSPSLTWLNIGRFLTSFGTAGIQTAITSWFMETMPASCRMLMNVGFGLGYTVPLLLAPVAAWWLDDWSAIILATGLTPLLVLPFYCLLYESPKWYVARRRLEDAEKTIISIIKFNRRSVPNMRHTMSNLHIPERSENESNFAFIDFFKTKNVRRNTICMFIRWVIGSLIYYKLVLSATLVPGDPYINSVLSSAAEIPAGLIGLYVAKRYSRRMSFVFFESFIVLVQILNIIIGSPEPWIKITLHMCLRFFVLSASFVGWIQVFEVFPTRARSFGFACCLVFSRIGAIIAPFMRDLGLATHPLVPEILFAVFPAISAFVALLLPETLDKPLPDTFEEAEKITRKMAPRPNKR